MIKLEAKETLLIMALPVESQGRFEQAGVDVHYCGIGKVNASIKIMDLIHSLKPRNILNLGTAGSHKFNVHQIVECNGFVQRDMDLTSLGFPRGETPFDKLGNKILTKVISQLPTGICGTGDQIEIGLPKLDCDLMDMEAYALAKACQKANINFTSIKYITDGSDQNIKKDWSGNLKKAADGLLNIYHEILSK